MNKNLPIDQFNAFIQYGQPYIAGVINKPLSNFSFGIKDIFDVAGFPTAFGSPDWLNTHPVATQTAPAVLDLVQQGATLVGKTHTDELTYSILGINAHYGTPTNPNYPNRIPGGSSSGSAVSVAGKLVDFAIGSDTGGSVRTPASFCGIYGMRPTHGRISLENARPLATSFDTLGWFARDPEILFKVGKSLLKEEFKPNTQAIEVVAPKQAWEIVPDGLRRLALKRVQEIFVRNNLVNKDLPSLNLKAWANTFSIIQANEIWQEHGAWASRHFENLGPGIKDRFLFASKIDPSIATQALDERIKIRNLLNSILDNKFLLIPTVADIAPLLNSTKNKLEDFRQKSFQLLCIAGLGGLPQISLPVVSSPEGALGISLVGPKDSDLELLSFAKALAI
jgi:amidase